MNPGGDKILTVVEGRDENNGVVNDLKNAAHARGWKFCRIIKLSYDDIVTGKVRKYFSPYVVWRGLIQSSVEAEDYLHQMLLETGHVVMNGQFAGGTQFSSDKCYMYQLYQLDDQLKEHSLPTYRVSTKKYLEILVERGDIKMPCLIKDRYGTAGGGIFLIKELDDYDQYAEKYDMRLFAAQNLVDIECEWRVFVIGGVAVCIMKKNYGEDIDRLNFEKMSSGYNRGIEDDEGTREIISDLAVRTAAVSKFEYTGIDIVREKDTGKYYVLETNQSAGWQNRVAQFTGVQVAERVMDWFVDVDYSRNASHADSIKQYIENRLVYLSRADQQLYEDIIGFKSDLEVEQGSKDLFSRILKAYNAVRAQEMDKEALNDLVDEVEQSELSWAGVFLPVGKGSLHEALLVSAAYVAIQGLK